MTKKPTSRLAILSYGLLVFNLVLAGFAIFSLLQKNTEISKFENKALSQVLGVRTVPIFDPNFVISDQTFSSTRAFGSSGDVQNFLERINSPLKNYREKGQSASYWIFAASRGQSSSKDGVVPQLNPGLILAYLEKEQSLLTVSGYDIYGDPDNRIKTAMGYGCPDDTGCDAKYYGFANQVNWAAYQLQFNYNIIQKNSKMAYPYVVASTITTLDEYNVFLTNIATAANYRYTPHTYWGNYNLWRLIVANGWGISSNTYTFAELDAANLENKDKILQNQENLKNLPKISEEEGKKLVRKEFYLGEDSKEIENLQIFLRQKGYYMTREITGLFGVVTEKALFNYRLENGIIIKEFTKNDKKTCLNLIAKNFENGEESEEIKSLQRCLYEINYFEWPVITGTFGPITAKGQAAAQKAFGQTANTTEAKVEPKTETKSETNCEDFKTQKWIDGQTSDEIAKLQECMRQDGVFSWPSNTGFFGPVTRASFDRWTAAKISSDCQNLKNQNWSEGETSERVRNLQACMRNARTFNWSGGNTGFFGSVTRQALIDWRGYL